MYQKLCLVGWIVVGAIMFGHAAPCRASSEPDRNACQAAIARARAAANTLPLGSMPRRFADSDLVQAKAEGGNGEFDDCLEFAAQAEDEARHPHHAMPATAKPHGVPPPATHKVER